MSSTVRETALDHISTAQPVAPLPAPEQGKALANGYAAMCSTRASCVSASRVRCMTASCGP